MPKGKQDAFQLKKLDKIQELLDKEYKREYKQRPYTQKRNPRRAVLWVNLPPDQKDELADICVRENKRIAEIVREIVEDWLERYRNGEVG
jgi:alpha-ketoglutarate-dependent taurine dioxygenase